MPASPPLEMETRPAVELDVDEIARVWLESYRHADGSPAEMPPFEHFRTRIETEMVSGMWAVTVAVCEGRIVAFLSLVPADSVLRELFVLPSMQRRGIGSLLLGQAMRALPEGFTLGAAAANLGACRFYEASGLELSKTISIQGTEFSIVYTDGTLLGIGLGI